MSNRWMAIGSFWVTKNHAWLDRMQATPNSEFFPLDETWNWASTLSGSYMLPYDVQLSGFLQAHSGSPAYRTYTFRSVPQLGTVSLPLEEFGSRREDTVAVLNLRVSKQFPVASWGRLNIDFDVFNVLNSNAAVATNWASGSTFGYVEDLTPARVARFGATFSF